MDVALTTTGNSIATEEDTQLECVLRIPMPSEASALHLVTILSVDAGVAGTSKSVSRWQEDTTRRTVLVVVRGAAVRSVRSAVATILEQSKLAVRTMRVFPPAGERK